MYRNSLLLTKSKVTVETLAEYQVFKTKMGALAQIFWVSLEQCLCRQLFMAKINIISENKFLAISYFLPIIKNNCSSFEEYFQSKCLAHLLSEAQLLYNLLEVTHSLTT